MTDANGDLRLHLVVMYKQERLDRIFSALSDPTRRSILARLEGQPRLSISDLAEPFAMTMPAVLKHLDILSGVGLIRRSKAGRTVWVEIEAGSMKAAMDWLQHHRLFWTTSLDRLTRYAEAKERETEAKSK
ncbi:MAG: ArsR/SmtB family transcription factor [Steroidobacteraceae bacterium]